MKVDLLVKDATHAEMLEILNMMNRAPATGFVSHQQPAPLPVMPIVTDTDLAELAATPQPQPPLAAAPQIVGVATAGEVDANGLPWDARIHSSSKTKTAKNIWVKRRNIQQSEITAVEAELRAGVVNNPGTVVMPSGQVMSGVQLAAQPQPTTPPAPVQMSPAAMFGTPAAVPMVDTRVIMPQPQPNPNAPVEDFNCLMSTIQMLFGNQSIDTVYMNNLSAGLGVATMSDVMGDPTRIANAFAQLRRDGKII